MQEPSSSERIQRVRIGLTGLAFVFLLVLLGTAVSRSGEGSPPETGLSGTAENMAAPGDPLAELGIAPGQSTAANEQGPADNSAQRQ